MIVDELLKELHSDFYTGVPDSLLKSLCNKLMSEYGISKNHIIAANEGNCTALAAGYYMATGKIPVVYMQNSGIGNIINPVASLLNDKVYAIPMVFVVGWRGEPGVHDEPQHIYQGEVTLKLLEDMDIKTFILDKNTSEEQLKDAIKRFQPYISRGKSVAFVVKKDVLTTDVKMKYHNDYLMKREDIIKEIIKVTGEDIIVSTTGKASRELFEAREENGQLHKYDFLTVGSMGHSSSIAMGIAMQKPETKVWIIDGDGAVLMHMGSMAVMGANKLPNMVHIVINNGAHETVGGLPTVAEKIDLCKIADGCGYQRCICVHDVENLKKELEQAKKDHILTFIEVKSSIGARDDLGRPTTTARENKEEFMKYLSTLE